MERFAFFSLLLTSAVCGLPNSLKTSFNSDKFDYEVVRVEVTNDVTYYGNDIEASLHLRTKAFGQAIDIRVKKMPSMIHQNYGMFSLELNANDEPVLRKVKLQNPDLPVYQDDNKTCVLHVSYDKDQLVMEGILSPELSIVPASAMGLRGISGKHVVIKNKSGYRANGRDYLDLSFAADVTSKLRGTDLPKRVNPELLAIVDYKNTKNLQFDDEEIQKYLAVFWNSVNTRYALVPDPKMELLLIGSIVIKDPNLQKFIEDARLDVDAINLHKTLPALAEYMHRNKDTFPKYDIAMLMTSENMAGNAEEGIMDLTVAGAAIVGGACEMTSSGMAEDIAPFYTGVLNHAHEIAHLLGSVHDGSPPYDDISGHPGAEECPFKDGYLMSYRFGRKEHLRWSNCTINQFRFFLSLERANCLLTVQNSQPIPLNDTLPGQLMGLDDQCEAFMGPTAKYFRNQNLTHVCKALYCYREENEHNILSRGPAYEGSPCGDDGGTRMWCRDGVCRQKSIDINQDQVKSEK